MTAEKYMIHALIGKKVVIIVPHQDDEINVAGSLIKQLSDNNIFCEVIYVTDGGLYIDPSRRKIEAIGALKCLGVPRNNIVFLGYEDFEDTNYQRTPEEIDEIVDDLYRLILDIKPDYIITNGEDEHPNHKEVSMLVDRAVESGKRTCSNYSPILLKTLAYDWAYHAEDDYRRFNLEETKIGKSNISEINWRERLRLPVPKEARTALLSNNCIYKSLWNHHSQTAYLAAGRIANSDKVYVPICINADDAIWFIKICIEDNYVYDYYTYGDKIELSAKAFSKDCKRVELDKTKIHFSLDKAGKRINIASSFSTDILDSAKKTKIYLEYDGIDGILDEIYIYKTKPSPIFEQSMELLDWIEQKVAVAIDWCINEKYRVKSFVIK